MRSTTAWSRNGRRPLCSAPMSFQPGEAMQVDYGEGAPTRVKGTERFRKPRLFVVTLRYSRRTFRRFVWSSQEVWAQLHARGERAAGGCGDGEAGLDCDARGCSGTPRQACVGRSQDAVSAWTGRVRRSDRSALASGSAGAPRRFSVAVCAVGERLGADV